MFSKAVAHALALDRKERGEQMRALRAIVRTGDVHDWSREFLRQAGGEVQRELLLPG
jgi:trehalose-6-phosphate synthase